MTSKRATALLSGSAALLVLLAAGCHPSCKEVCSKLLDCDEVESSRVSDEECRTACLRQEEQYEDWEDFQALDTHYEERSCIVDASCQDIADGGCYDEELYLF